MHTARPQADGHPGVESVADQVTAQIASTLGLQLEEVLPACSLRDDFGMDDNELTRLWVALEGAFRITIPGNASAAWLTVGDVIRYVERRNARGRACS